MPNQLPNQPTHQTQSQAQHQADSVQITDVLLRDGLQDEKSVLTPEQRIDLGQQLAAAGVTRMEIGSMVNPARVPQMAGSEDVLAGLQRTTDAELTMLVLNARGVQRAVDAGAEHIQIVASASEAHSQRNAGRSVETAIAELGEQLAVAPDTHFFAGISTAFTCPFEGEIPAERLVRIVRQFAAMGVTEIGLADTLGTTEPEKVMASLDTVLAAEPELTYHLHLHNAHGRALDTVDAALRVGVRRFDAAVGGYGGCPFAPGAAGNLATEELVRHLHAAGVDTGIDPAAVAEVSRRATALLAAAPALDLQESR
ncbi:hydroxymethylglutaryl-CoA lyase [Citricoccus sp. NR2]|uniref:hydroxymethylglutaryl-CoA lyase n=1 Tax=Citricoccus sp. NR2 TaxID=3004095 RepID=UPI0022DE1A5C|nr:hydroxymethylglutaryl-CoA lyase [Citricoccus sp. NR2]WBL19452.1 hydroxymethylglutaryl-CoA lyase [Citricoccus sp. NR2]